MAFYSSKNLPAKKKGYYLWIQFKSGRVVHETLDSMEMVIDWMKNLCLLQVVISVKVTKEE